MAGSNAGHAIRHPQHLEQPVKNLVYDEVKFIDAAAPSGGVISGTAYLIGALLAVAIVTAAEGETVAFRVTGGVDLPKASGAITQFAKLYWDDTNKRLTTTASGNTLVGVAGKPAASGDATVCLLLNFNP